MVYTPDNFSFVLNDVEKARADEWIKKHKKICEQCKPEERGKHMRLFIQGDHISYIFTPNSAYVMIEITCVCTEEKTDITDYDSV